MLTRCPTCQTTFRVTAEQLKARQGRVRCGHCQGVFNALETLVEAAPVAAPAPTTDRHHVVIHGFEVPTIDVAPRQPAPSAPPAIAEPAPKAEPIEIAPPATEGEEVAEPSVEYVEIGDLSLGDELDEENVAAADETVEDVLVRTDINIPPLSDADLAEPEEIEPAPEPSPDDQFTKTVVGFTWYVEPEPPVDTPSPLPAEEDFAKTVVQSIRIAEPAAPAEASRPEPAAIEPTPPAPTPESSAKPAGAADEDLWTKTVVQTVRIAEPAAPVEPMPAPPIAATPPKPAGRSDEASAAETVASTIRMIEPAAPAAAAGFPLEDEFTRTVVQPRLSEPRPATREPAAPVFAFPSIEPLAAQKPEATTPARTPVSDEFIRTEVDLPGPASEETIEDWFELAPIENIQVEEQPEKPSIVELSVRPPTTFPTLPELAEADEHFAGVSANAILEQLTADAGAAATPVADHIEIEAPSELILDDETATIPARKPHRTAPASADAALSADAEPPAPPQALAIPELQELPARRRWPWVLGSLIGLCVLAVQAIVYFRVELAVLMPRYKPALVAFCDVLDCKVPLPSQIDLIGIETSDLTPGPEGAGQLQLAATLRNRAPFVQAWPDLELTLTDNADKALVRRILAPADYLPPSQKAGTGFPARSEQTVYLDLKAPGVPAVGYRLYVFYP